jgi:hypothetical protein
MQPSIKFVEKKVYRAAPFVTLLGGDFTATSTGGGAVWASLSENNADIYTGIQPHLHKTIPAIVRPYNLNRPLKLIDFTDPKTLSEFQKKVSMNKSFVIKNGEVRRVTSNGNNQLKANIRTANDIRTFLKQYGYDNINGWFHNRMKRHNKENMGNNPGKQAAEILIFTPYKRGVKSKATVGSLLPSPSKNLGGPSGAPAASRSSPRAPRSSPRAPRASPRALPPSKRRRGLF